MGVHKFDSPLRFLVDSHSRGEIQHLVDLSAYELNGECSCEHFTHRLRKHLEKGAEPGDHLRCHHIKDARAHVADALVTQEALKAGGRPKRSGARTYKLDPTRRKYDPRPKNRPR